MSWWLMKQIFKSDEQVLTAFCKLEYFGHFKDDKYRRRFNKLVEILCFETHLSRSKVINTIEKLKKLEIFYYKQFEDPKDYTNPKGINLIFYNKGKFREYFETTEFCKFVLDKETDGAYTLIRW